MNYLKSRANRLKENLDPDLPDPVDLDEIDHATRRARSRRLHRPGSR